MDVRDVMTVDPVICPSDTTVVEAARLMSEHDIGDVLVHDGSGALSGIVTDRDLVVRALATGVDLVSATLADVLNGDAVHTVPADASTDDAAALMRQQAIRRVPVVDQDRPIGIVSLGDLAERLDAGSALADISSAPADQ